MVEVIIVGNLASEPETRTLQSGTTIVTASIAGSNGFGERKSTEFYRLTFFGNNGNTIKQYCHKGDKLFVTGELTFREWDAQDGVHHKDAQVAVSRFELCGGRKEAAPASAPAPAKAARKTSAAHAPEPAVDLEEDDDSLPF